MPVYAPGRVQWPLLHELLTTAQSNALNNCVLPEGESAVGGGNRWKAIQDKLGVCRAGLRETDTPGKGALIGLCMSTVDLECGWEGSTLLVILYSIELFRHT